MSDAANHPPNDRNSRLRDALRENLKRRKSQLRGRLSQAATPEDSVAATVTPVGERSGGGEPHED